MTITNTFAPNTVIASAQFNTNFQTDIRDKFNSAFNGSTGHTHDGQTGNGAPIVLQNASPTVTRQLGASAGILQFYDGTAARTVFSLENNGQVVSGTKIYQAVQRFDSPNFHIRSSGAAFDLILGVSTVFSADRTLNIDIGDASRTVTLGGDITTMGAYALILNLTAATNIAFPTTGTLATLAGSETFTNKALTSPTMTTPKVTSGSLNDQGDQATAVTFDWSLGNHHRVRLTGTPVTVTFSNPGNRQKITAEFVQDGTGSRIVTLPTNVRWLNGSGATDSTTDKPTFTTTANKMDVVTFYYNSTLSLYYAVMTGFKGAIT